jgi:hypothetical protein
MPAPKEDIEERIDHENFPLCVKRKQIFPIPAVGPVALALPGRSQFVAFAMNYRVELNNATIPWSRIAFDVRECST